MPQVGLAELRHARVHIRPHRCPIEQHLAQPFRPKLRAHAVQRRRNAAGIAQPLLVRAEVLKHRIAHAARTIARMAGNAVESRHGMLNLLPIRQRFLNPCQSLTDGCPLEGGQMKIRHAVRLLGQASPTRPKLGHRHIQLRLLIRQLMARRAVQTAEHRLTRRHRGRIREKLCDLQLLRPQQKCRDGARLVAREIHIRHTSRRPGVMRLKQKRRQRIKSVLGRHML